MSSLNFIGGEKGGVGKSVVARLLAQYFIDRGWPFTGFDSDRSHASFARFYADYASPVTVDSFDGLDQVVACYEALDRSGDAPESSGTGSEASHAAAGEGYEAPRVVVDLAAQTATPLARWVHESELFTVMRDLGVVVNYWHVSDGGQDSIDLLDRAVHSFGDGANLIVVKNHGRGSDFSRLEDSAPMRAAFARGARVIGIGALHDASMARIDRHSRSFWAAANNRSGTEALGLLERQRTKAWLRTCYAAFESLPL